MKPTNPIFHGEHFFFPAPTGALNIGIKSTILLGGRCIIIQEIPSQPIDRSVVLIGFELVVK